MDLATTGSTVDPCHLLHARTLSIILRAGFDMVEWSTSGSSSFKPNATAGIHRQQMAHLAFPQRWIYSPLPGWAKLMLDLSATMGADIPTAIRFQQLRQQYPGANITFVTGSDAVTPMDGIFPIQRWDHYDQLLSKEKIKIIPRKGFAQPGEIVLPDHISWMDSPPLEDVRSSTIREMIKAGNQEWRKYVNRKVESYIDLHKLYLNKEEEKVSVEV